MPDDADTRIALDTSVAIPLLVNRHHAHRAVRRWLTDRATTPTLCGHAIAETYSVLTRLPGDLAVSPGVAVRVLASWFPDPLPLSARMWSQLPADLAAADIAGGAVYDALVAFSARENRLPLATRDSRARRTYERLGVSVEIVS